MRNTFKILFYIKRKSLLRNGLAPIMSRITVNGTRIQLSTQQAVDPLDWDVHHGRAAGRSLRLRQLNERLDSIRFRLETCYNQLLEERLAPTPENIKGRYLGCDSTPNRLLAFYRCHNEEFQQMVDISRSKSTLYKYRCVYSHLETFIRAQYHKSDFSFNELDRSFLVAFHRYMAQVLTCKKNTVWVYMIAFKHILMLARSKGYLKYDLFANYKVRCEQIERNYLTDSEICRIMQLALPDRTHRLIRDAFVFSCFTGLSYVDLRALTLQQILERDNRLWIRTKRQKTGTEVLVRLFDLPARILEQNRPEDTSKAIFSLPVNSWCNAKLSDMAKLAGISGAMTFHVARHTFATTIMLSRGMPIETISKLLGHRNIRTTQIYAAVTHAKLTDDMDRLSQQLDLAYR